MWSSTVPYLPFVVTIGDSATDNKVLHHRIQKDQQQEQQQQQQQQQQQKEDEEMIEIIHKDKFPTAFTSEFPTITAEQRQMIQRLNERVTESTPDFPARASSDVVRWGGPTSALSSTATRWYTPASTSTASTTASLSSLEQLHGGNLFYSYLRIMKWPSDLRAHFPFKLCKKDGCDADVAIQHTLTFREVYRPYLVTPKMRQVNARGLIYQRGLSPPYVDTERGSHGIVWLRPAVRVHVDEVTYTRTIVRELERAVAVSMDHSKGRVGKFNAVIDGQGFSLGATPSLNGIKTFVTILQDHYVDRLGVLILTNLGTFAELVLKLFLPLITEDVRKKIVVLPHDEQERRVVLETVLGKENIPVWLGGDDEYEFNVDEYYDSEDTVVGTDEEAMEYLELMPYHST
jgi:hypothetical protein